MLFFHKICLRWTHLNLSEKYIHWAATWKSWAHTKPTSDIGTMTVCWVVTAIAGTNPGNGFGLTLVFSNKKGFP